MPLVILPHYRAPRGPSGPPTWATIKLVDRWRSQRNIPHSHSDKKEKDIQPPIKLQGHLFMCTFYKMQLFRLFSYSFNMSQ